MNSLLRTFEKCSDIAVQDHFEETFVLNLGQSTVHCLGDIESRIWAQIDGQTTTEGIVGVICQEYEVDRPQAEADVIEFLSDLAAKGLIREKEDG